MASSAHFRLVVLFETGFICVALAGLGFVAVVVVAVVVAAAAAAAAAEFLAILLPLLPKC